MAMLQVLHRVVVGVWCGAAAAGAHGEPEELRPERGRQEGQAGIVVFTHQILTLAIDLI